MKKSTLLLKDIHLKPSQIHKFRGFIGNLFRDYDLIHNHDPVTDADIAVF
ncbi:MAG: DNA repair protein, partial [Desulfobacteraceae bacterium]|nr:DNA repair protein [Desulfobacteraceae bacterium]